MRLRTRLLMAWLAALLHGAALAQTPAEDLQALEDLQRMWVRDPAAARAQLMDRSAHLDTVRDPRVRREYLEAQIRAALHAGHMEQAREAIARLSAFADSQHDEVARVLAEAARTHLLLGEGRSAEARTLLAQLQPAAERTGDAQSLWIVHLEQGRLLSAMGQFEPALTHTLASLDHAARRPRLSEVSLLLSEVQLTQLYIAMKNAAQALKAIDQAEQRAVRLGATSMQGALLLNRGNVQSGLGHTDAALAAYQSALRIAVNADRADLQAAALNNIGDIHLIRKAYHDAEPIERQAVAKYEEAHDPGGAALSRANLGFALMGQGRVDEGAAQVQAALETMRQAGNRTNEEIVLEEFSRMYEQAGRYREAVEVARTQQRLSRELLRSDREKAVAELQARFDAVQRERQIDSLAQDNRLKDAELKQHRLVLIAAAAGTLVVLAGGAVIFLMYRRARSANAALRVAQRQAESALQEKNLFLATASHDLRQPIHAMSLMVEALGLRNANPALTPLVADLRQSMTALNQQFNALLDLSRLETGAVSASATSVELAPLLRELVRLFREQATVAGLSLRLRLPATDPVVRADPVLLRQALVNLIHNAIRYTRQGGVLIGARRRGEDWQIEVWDSGIGIAADEGERVFSPFFRSTQARRVDSAGHGLGLAVVARAAQLMGATCGFQSRPGRGSRFWLRVPSGEALAAARRQAEVPARDAAPFRRLSGTCLVLDDDPQVLTAWQALLESWGVSARLAATAAEAHALLDQGFAPQAIFCDQRLHTGDSGFAVLTALLARCPEASGAMVSGELHSAELARAEEEGYLVLRKPLDPVALHTLLAHWLDGPDGGFEAESPAPGQRISPSR